MPNEVDELGKIITIACSRPAATSIQIILSSFHEAGGGMVEGAEFNIPYYPLRIGLAAKCLKFGMTLKAIRFHCFFTGTRAVF